MELRLTSTSYHGTGMVPYEVALTAVFVEGWVFVGLTLLGIRQWVSVDISSSTLNQVGLSSHYVWLCKEH